MPRCSPDDERAAVNGPMRRKIRAALDDPRADIPAEEVLARLCAYHEDELKVDPDRA